MNYTEVLFSFQPLQPWSEILVAYLSDLEFESFEDTDYGIKAYISADVFNLTEIESICETLDCDIAIQHKIIKQQNWNAKWESDFQPILIANNCGIRAKFHKPLDVEYEIIITPKMSFGTGHHATTNGMMTSMFDLDFFSKRVLDMGCGTAVLAILAEKLGSNEIQAIDVEEWAYKNAIENSKMNTCNNIQVLWGGKEKIEGDFDIILANINRNILLEDMSIYSKHLKQDGIILLSGFYIKDLDKISEEAINNKLQYINHTSQQDWVTAKFKKM